MRMEIPAKAAAQGGSETQPELARLNCVAARCVVTVHSPDAIYVSVANGQTEKHFPKSLNAYSTFVPSAMHFVNP